jgi:TatD DNase family protein
MLDFIDTHAHLNLPEFDPDREEVIQRAKDAGIGHILVPGIDLPSSQMSVDLAQRFKGLSAAVGIHPHEAKRFKPGDLLKLRELARSPQVKAIGEIGLDFYRKFSPKSDQVRAFEAQVRLAKDLSLPIVVHTRAAVKEALGILQEESNGLEGVLHCFEGTKEQAERALALGLHISFTGVVTFPRSPALKVAKSVPLERLLLETDSPYLAPVPHRGKRNEPKWVRLVAESIALAKGMDLEVLVTTTSQEAVELFALSGVEAK